MGWRLVGVERIGPMRRASVGGSEKRLVLLSWTLLLDHLAAAVQGDTSVASDIHQLRSLAQQQDEEAFQPLHQAEFAPALPRRLRALHRLIDDVIVRAEDQGLVTTAGRISAAQREGYGRYFQFTAIRGDILLCVDLSLWAARGDTPIWLRLSKDVHPERLLDRFPQLSEQDRGWSFDLPIALKNGVEYGTVLELVLAQLVDVDAELKESRTGTQ